MGDTKNDISKHEEQTKLKRVGSRRVVLAPGAVVKMAATELKPSVSLPSSLPLKRVGSRRVILETGVVAEPVTDTLKDGGAPDGESQNDANAEDSWLKSQLPPHWGNHH